MLDEGIRDIIDKLSRYPDYDDPDGSRAEEIHQMIIIYGSAHNMTDQEVIKVINYGG